jgi:signal transduction histidine kinase
MPEPAPDRPAWYRSLYWRIALGFILCVAAVLAAQAGLFLWLASRTDPALLRSPQDLAAVTAAEISAALDASPDLDIDRYLAREYGRARYALALVMADGRVHRNRDAMFPPPLLRAIRKQLAVERAAPASPPAAAPDEDGLDRAVAERSPTPDPPGERTRVRLRRPPMGRVVVKGTLVGLTVVLPGPSERNPFLAAHGTTLAAAALGLLLVGTATMAFVVFRPVRRRLQALEEAATAVGGGDTSARAPETGGDEVAALAKRFNRMASDLDARVRDLEQADRSRRQLLADVSHELMTPLTAMRGYLETLAVPRAVPDEATRERYLRIVTEETLRLEAIIGDLLEVARLESGGGDLRHETVSVDRLFARAAERHESVLRDKGLALECEVAAGAGTVLGDERRLEQAVQNLVANAVHHTPRGGRISLGAERRDGRVALAVSDTGPGIPPEHLPRIFDRFYRVQSARDQASGGSGLGLSIVRAVIERHGGSVTAANRAGGGARFEIVLDAGASRSARDQGSD